MDVSDLKGLFAETSKRMGTATEHVRHELSGVRTGRASVTILDSVHVDAYGARMPLNQLAGLSVPEPSLIVAQPFDPSTLAAIEKAAESAAGQYPQDAVATMSRIAEEVETDTVYRSIINAQRGELTNATSADAIAVAARDVAQTLHSKAICAWTSSGSTAWRIARERPLSPILALTPKLDTARRLALVWGVHALETRDASDIEDMVSRACEYSRSEGFGEDGDRIIIVAGMPFGTPGATNMIRIAHMGEE